MNQCLIGAMIVVVTFAIIYVKSAREVKSNQEFLALEKGLLKGCLASLVLLLLPIFGSLAFPKVQPNLSAVIFVLELAGIMLFSLVELRRLNYRGVKLCCLLALLAGIALIWCQLFSYYQMDRDFFGSLGFIMATFPTWLLGIVTVVFTFLGGPKLRAKKKSKTETEDAKLLRKQLERLQNEYSALQRFNEELTETILMDTIQRGTPESKSESVTEDKKAESNLPKNTQAEEESTTKVEEAQTTTSAPKSDAEDKSKVKVTNPSMSGIQQQKLSEILDLLNSDSSSEEQQVAIEEIVKSYRTATVQEVASKEKALSQGPKPTDSKVASNKEQEEPEEEEEVLDSVDFGDNYEDETILADLFAKISPLAGILAVAIIFVVCVGIRVFA